MLAARLRSMTVLGPCVVPPVLLLAEPLKLTEMGVDVARSLGRPGTPMALPHVRSQPPDYSRKPSLRGTIRGVRDTGSSITRQGSP